MTPWIEILRPSGGPFAPPGEFEKFVEGQGASEEQIAWLERTIFAPVEADWIVRGSAADWPMPQHPLPPSYLDLLRLCDGVDTGDTRQIQCFVLRDVRNMMLSYEVPYYWPLAATFAFDGGGTFYAFDMREPPDEHGEFPIVMCHAGSLGWDKGSGIRKIADSLEQCFRDAMEPSD